MAYTLRTQVWIDFVNFFTLRNGIIRAFRFAHIAVNALICNKRATFLFPFFLNYQNRLGADYSTNDVGTIHLKECFTPWE